ncbi:uncharacterized [Tachysurus ichikawai]
MAGNGRGPVGVSQAQGMLGTLDCGRRRLCRRSECARCSVLPQQRKEDIVLREMRHRPGGLRDPPLYLGPQFQHALIGLISMHALSSRGPCEACQTDIKMSRVGGLWGASCPSHHPF